MQAVVATQRKITPEPKKEALKEPEVSYAKFVGGVEVLNLKAGGTKLKAFEVRIFQHSKNDHSSSLADLELLLRVPD